MIQPPRLGPRVGATTTETPYRAKAPARFAGEKVSVMIDCSLAARPPPPRPCNTRKKIGAGRLVAMPHSIDAAVNTATEIM